jgi:hypothetical protein
VPKKVEKRPDFVAPDEKRRLGLRKPKKERKLPQLLPGGSFLFRAHLHVSP